MEMLVVEIMQVEILVEMVERYMLGEVEMPVEILVEMAPEMLV